MLPLLLSPVVIILCCMSFNQWPNTACRVFSTEFIHVHSGAAARSGMPEQLGQPIVLHGPYAWYVLGSFRTCTEYMYVLCGQAYLLEYGDSDGIITRRSLDIRWILY
ncbi:hypothetical protein V8C37DRAFT_366583 [Trichoderma ceciliae]